MAKVMLTYCVFEWCSLISPYLQALNSCGGSEGGLRCKAQEVKVLKLLIHRYPGQTKITLHRD